MQRARKRESKFSPRRIGARERQRQALELRQAGLSFQRIADELGYRSRSGAYMAIKAIVEEVDADAVDDYRRLNMPRLNTLLGGIWQPARAGDIGAVNSAVRLISEMNKMLGVHAPVAVTIEWRKAFESMADRDGLAGPERENAIDQALAIVEASGM